MRPTSEDRARLKLLGEPVLVDPPACACKGEAPHMREHTALWCSVLSTAELNALSADPLEASAVPGYDVPPQARPAVGPGVGTKGGVADDHGMSVPAMGWVMLSLLLAAVLVITVILVAPRP